MHIALTGATGFIGSHILTELLAHGHDVTALVRNDAACRHRGRTRCNAGRGRPLRPTSGHQACSATPTARSTPRARAMPPAPTWTPPWSMPRSRRSRRPGSPTPTSAASGSTAPTSISEDSPFDPPALVAWKEPIERRVLDARACAASCRCPASPTATAAEGLPGLLLGLTRDADGNLIMLGTGQQHWSTSTSPTWQCSSGAHSRPTRPWLLRHRQRPEPHRG